MPLDKPRSLFDREVEWSTLESLWGKSGPSLAFVIGRRRVGKSHLLTRFADRVGGLYYQATNRTESEQLATISAVVGARFDDPALRHGVPFPSWEALFGYVVERIGGDPFLLVLDEFPYLAESVPAFASILQSLWDHEWRKTRLKLILSGSHVTAMKRLEGPDQPLYGRRTARILVEPFHASQVAHFFPSASALERIQAFGIFGGLPGNLALIDREADLMTNVIENVLHPSARLHDEAQHMLDAFLAGSEVHYSVIAAIAAGERTWGGISKRVGRAGGSLNRAVEWLTDMNLIERVVPLSEPVPRKSKRAIYRIVDPYLSFWHRFMLPLISAGMTKTGTGRQIWRSRIAPGLDDHMSEIFEDISRSFMQRAGATFPFAPVRVGSWWDHQSRNEIDVVALGEDRELLVGESKWGRADRHDLESLKQRTDLLLSELQGVRRVYYALFTGRGVRSDLGRMVDGKSIIHIDADTLLER